MCLSSNCNRMEKILFHLSDGLCDILYLSATTPHFLNLISVFKHFLSILVHNINIETIILFQTKFSWTFIISAISLQMSNACWGWDVRTHTHTQFLAHMGCFLIYSCLAMM